MILLTLLACLQGGTQETVERALSEDDREKRRAMAAPLAKVPFADVEKAVRTQAWGLPKAELGKVIEHSSKIEQGNEAFTYALHVPAAYDPAKAWPLLVTLHGFNPEGRPAAGSEWIQSWLRCAGARERFILLAPTTTRHTWGSRQGHSFVLTAVAEVARELHVDPDRVYLDGMSMGAGGAFRLAEHYPDRWAAIGPRCNVPDVRQKQDKSYVPMLCENYRNVPVYWAVGAKDDRIPLAAAHAARDAFQALKYDVLYREHADGGHDWSIEKDDDVLAWYETQRRRTYPEEIVFKTFENVFMRAYWVQVLKRTEAPPIVTVHMDMKNQESERRTEYRPPALVRAKRAGNAIDVACEEVKELRVWLDDAMADLDKAVTVTVNGKKVHDGVVKRSLDTLLEEAHRRGERSMTFSAHVDVKVR
jgi:poly(3-hydroxybutyrate) depolymerase